MFNNSRHCFTYQHLTLFLKRWSLRSLVPSARSRLFLTSGVHCRVPPPCVGANRHLTCHRSVAVHRAQLDAWGMTHAHLPLTRRLLPHYYRLHLNLSSPNFIVFHVHTRARQSRSFLTNIDCTGVSIVRQLQLDTVNVVRQKSSCLQWHSALK